jgi:hypothetical protein
MKVEYSLEEEINRIESTLRDMDWFKECGYKGLVFPKKMDPYKNSKEEIIEALKKEYNPENYKKFKEKLSNNYKNTKIPFNKKLKEIFGQNIDTKFEVIFTRYGTGGSYNPNSNIIIINIKFADTRDWWVFNTFIHEAIHIFLESYIKKYKIEHWDKERTVDLIINSKEFDFLNIISWQNNYREVEKYIDPLFNKYFFKDKDKYFKELRKLYSKK